jgi:hypothetical protein
MALFAKLDAIGIRGRTTLSLIKQMYGETRFAVRTPLSQPLGAALPHRIEMVHQLKGLRQGCPMSPPTLFNVFINDLFDMDIAFKTWAFTAISCPTRRVRQRIKNMSRYVVQQFRSLGYWCYLGAWSFVCRWCSDSGEFSQEPQTIIESVHAMGWSKWNAIQRGQVRRQMAFGKERKKRNRKSSSTENSAAVPTAADRVVNDGNAGVVDDNQHQNVPNMSLLIELLGLDQTPW